MSAMDSCPPVDALVQSVLRVADDATAARVEAHAAACGRCARAVRELERARGAADATAHLDPALIARWDALHGDERSAEVATALVHLRACEECASDLDHARAARAAFAAAPTAIHDHAVRMHLPAAAERAVDAVREFFAALIAQGGYAVPAAAARGSEPAARFDAAAALSAVTRGEQVRLTLGDGVSALVSHDVAGAALVVSDVRRADGAAPDAVLIVRNDAETVAVSDETGAVRIPFADMHGDLALHLRT